MYGLQFLNSDGSSIKDFEDDVYSKLLS